MPELYVVLVQRVFQLHADAAQGFQGSVGPVAVSGHEARHVRGVAQISVRAVRTEKRLDGIPSLPVGHVSGKHAAVVRRFVDEDFRVQPFPGERLAECPCQSGDFTVGGRCAFLFRTHPIPMAVRLIDGADVGKLDAVMLFQPFHHVSSE